jgi:hypothetical protein
MKLNNIKKLFLLAVLAGSFSCKKELNVYPTTSEVDGNVIIDAKSASTVLNGVYYRLAAGAQDYNGQPSANWTDVHESLPSQLSGLADYTGGGSDLNLFTLDIYNDASYLIWDYDYKLVNAASGFLKNLAPVTNIPDKIKRQLKAEGLFLRAFANAELLLYFGEYNKPGSEYGIILRNEFVSSANISVPRATVSETYQSILSDLDEAIVDLPNKNTQVYYTNVWAAKLLKARVLINRGATGDYAEVVKLTTDIIANSPFELEARTADIFLSKAFASKEVILGIQPFANQGYKFSQYVGYLYYTGMESLVNLLQNDPRSTWMYKDVDDPSYGTLHAITKYYSGSLDPDLIAPTPTGEYGYVFRLTEAYLLKAEALALTNTDLPAARSLLKTVMGHAGITDFSAVDNAAGPVELQELVVKETMKNFALENGADWFALRRLPFATLQTLRPEIASADLLVLPIGYSELHGNGKIKQIPAYQ